MRCTAPWSASWPRAARARSLPPRTCGYTPFTTAKIAHGRLLAVDSQFGFPGPYAAQDRVVELKVP